MSDKRSGVGQTTWEEAVAQVRQLLEVAEGAVLILVVGEGEEARRLFAAMVEANLPRGLVLRPFVFSPEHLNPFTDLRKGFDRGKYVTMISGLDNLEVAKQRKALELLNWNRSLMERGPSRLIMWVEPGNVRRLYRHAGDFADWWNALIELPPELPAEERVGELVRPQPTLRVFVSSTWMDNRGRRRLVEEAILTAGMLPVGMERFAADTRTPVDVCLDEVRECDLLVGIIAWRYGWIPEGQDVSITELEYGAARERLMFELDPDQKVDPRRDFDDGPDVWAKQEKLAAFKERYRRDGTPALFRKGNLGPKILRALLEWAERREQGSARPPVPPPPPSDNEVAAYCRWAEQEHSTLPLAGFGGRLRVPIDVEELYVPLHALVDERRAGAASFADAEEAETRLREAREAPDVSLAEAFVEADRRRRRGLVILGDPGSGKTMHLKRLVLWCLRREPEELGLPGTTLPVFLPLRELERPEAGLAAFVEEQLSHPHLDAPAGLGRRLLERGDLLLLLDGLNEVADVVRRREVSAWIEAAAKAYPTCRLVVTCRFAGYDEAVRLSERFLELHVRPLTAEQAGSFVHNWYRAIETGLFGVSQRTEARARARADELLERLAEPDFRARRVFGLTRNPLLLANLCLVHRDRGRLPTQRARLYEECIDVLLEHWREGKRLPVTVTAKAGRRVLQPAALWLHEEEGRTRAGADELTPAIQPALEAVRWEGGDARAFLRAVRDESGLLTGWGREVFGFMHLGFQEYLAARELRSRAFSDPAVLGELADRFGESWWQEVILLLLALEDPSLFEPLLREVVARPAFVAHPELVEACLDDAAEVSEAPFSELARGEAGRDEGRWARQLSALRVLERLGSEALDDLAGALGRHPSPEVRRWAAQRAAGATQEVVRAARGGYELVRIPAGRFVMGSPESEEGRRSNEGPAHEVEVPGFYLGRVPVTNEEYGRFLEADPAAPEPRYWGDRKLNQPRQPVVGVSWHDAQRYAAWAGLRLPSEAEWEVACRAGTRTRYHSGDAEEDLDRAGWYGANAGGRTHPVGEKEPNGFGLYDVHGNVWEWVEDDWHDSYDGAQVDGRPWVDDPRGSGRVIRGGSWNGTARDARAAHRHQGRPGERVDALGFRLARF